MIRAAHRFRRHPGATAILVALGFASGPAFAQPSPALDRFDLSLGGYHATVDTTVGASTSDGEFRGHFNLEDDLGFRKHQSVPRVRLNFLIGDSQGFSFDYFSVNRSRGTTLTDDGSDNNDDTTAFVRGKLDFDFGSASYRWWFGHGNNVLGLGLGGAWYRVQASIRGDATENGEAVDEVSAGTGARAWAPTLQLGWRYAFNDQWRMYADASGVKKNGGRLHGHIYNVDLGVTWYPWNNLGFGAEYGYTQIKLNQRHTYYGDGLDMRLNGPSLFAKFRF